MKDRYHKKANVLGIDVSVMRVDKAVNVIDAWKGTSCNLFFISHQFAVMSK